MINLTGKRCQCPTCERVFSTEQNFDRHRQGEFGSRVCLDPLTVGMKKQESGVYVRALNDDRFQSD